MATDANGKHVPEPGDPDFDWNDPMAVAKFAATDPVAAAKQTLTNTQSNADLVNSIQTPAPTPSQPTSADIAGRFLGAATAPFRPSNILSGLKAMVPGTTENEQYQLSQIQHPILSALQQASPLTGGAGFSAGARIAQGDVAGGLGEATGDILAAAAPLAIPEIPAAARTAASLAGKSTSAIGRAMEAVGGSSLARTSTPLATMNAIVRPSVGSFAAAALPPTLEFGGRGLQKLGSALQGLGETGPAVERFGPVNVSRYPMSTEVPGSSMPYEPGDGWYNTPKATPASSSMTPGAEAPSSGVSPFPYEDTALREIGNPDAQAYLARESAANAPLAARVNSSPLATGAGGIRTVADISGNGPAVYQEPVQYQSQGQPAIHVPDSVQGLRQPTRAEQDFLSMMRSKGGLTNAERNASIASRKRNRSPR